MAETLNNFEIYHLQKDVYHENNLNQRFEVLRFLPCSVFNFFYLFIKICLFYKIGNIISIANFASSNLAPKLSAVNLLNSWVAI